MLCGVHAPPPPRNAVRRARAHMHARVGMSPFILAHTRGLSLGGITHRDVDNCQKSYSAGLPTRDSDEIRDPVGEDIYHSADSVRAGNAERISHRGLIVIKRFSRFQITALIIRGSRTAVRTANAHDWPPSNSNYTRIKTAFLYTSIVKGSGRALKVNFHRAGAIYLSGMALILASFRLRSSLRALSIVPRFEFISLARIKPSSLFNRECTKRRAGGAAAPFHRAE